MPHLFTILLLLLLTIHQGYCSEHKETYWQTQRKGANFFNKKPVEEWFQAAKKAGIQFARLAPDKWRSQGRDFLVQNADSFTDISIPDFQQLLQTLDQAEKHEIKIVITLLSLPGSRWKQNNNNQDDLRLWKSKTFQAQAISFWKKLAALLKNHPAVVGYNILNEPHPECLFGYTDFQTIDFQKWHQSVKHSCADLNLFYKKIVRAIREVDTCTPIILDTGLFATPWAIRYLAPIHDPHVVYSFHMYEPYAYTTRKVNKTKYRYPGSVPLALIDAEQNTLNAPALKWNKKALKQFLKPISDWQKKFHVPNAQILVGEFGCDRTSKGANKYLQHLIDIFEAHKWHWAFYSFREDCWDNMDYELGAGKVPWQYWEAAETGTTLDPFRHNNPLFDVIQRRLRK